MRARLGAVPPHIPERLGLFKQLWRRWQGKDVGPRNGLGDRILINVMVGAGFYALLVLMVQVVDGAGASWQVRKFVDPAALLIAAAAAFRLRARGAALLLGGMGVATGAEALMDLWFGGPAVRGGPAHFALLIAGVAGVALGALYGRRSGTRPRSSLEAATAETDPLNQETTSASAGDRFSFSPSAQRRLVQTAVLR